MTEQPAKRTLTTIFYTDVVDYSRLTGLDEEGTHNRVMETLDNVSQKIISSGGTVLRYAGDAILATFPSVVQAVQTSTDIQSKLVEDNMPFPEEARVHIRIGINLGDVIEDRGEVFGDGVNLAARLEAAAEPGGICISSTVWEQCQGKINSTFADGGEQQFKNISRPVRTFHWEPSTAQPGINLLNHDNAISDKPSIAVLPFDNMSGDPEQGYFADGIVDGITTALSRITAFFVIACTSAFIFKDQAVSFEKVRDTLGVRYFLEGGVHKAGDRVRINVQLIETTKGAHVWAEKYDGALSNIFELQDNIIEQVAGALHPSIRQAEIDRSRRKRPQDLGAYDYVMRAMPFVWSLNENDNQEATRLLAEAINLDPNYPLAISLKAWCLGQQATYNWSSTLEETKAETLSMAKQAAALSGDDPLVLTILGAAHTIINDHESANVFLERSVLLDPNSAWAWSRLGWSNVYGEKIEDAIEHFQTALRLSPYDPMNFNCYIGIGCAYAIARDFENSIINFERGLNEHPGAIWVYRNLIPVYMEIGRIEDAQNGVRQLLQSYPELTATKVREAMAFQEVELNWIYEHLVKAGLPA